MIPQLPSCRPSPEQGCEFEERKNVKSSVLLLLPQKKINYICLHPPPPPPPPLSTRNHKEYGVTSEGVNVFLEVALRRALNIDPKSQPFSIKMTGELLFSAKF